MEVVKKILMALPNVSMDRLNALIALSGIGLAAFALYVVLNVAK